MVYHCKIFISVFLNIKRKKMKKLLTLTLFCPVFMSAQGYQVHVQGQKQQAMGNAGTGFVQDCATLFYNPGGLSFLKENAVSIGGTAAIVNTIYYDSITNTVTKANIPTGIAPTLYSVYGVDTTRSKLLQKFKFGLGIYVPFAGSAKWPDDWVGRFILKSTDLKVVSIQPTVSFKINDKIGVGAGFVYSMGSIDVSKDIFLTNNTVGNYASVDVKGKLSGYGINAGVYIQPTEAFSVGLTYRSAVKMRSKGATAEFTNVPNQLRDSIIVGGGSTTGPMKTDVSTTLPLPTIISLGFGYKFTDKFALAFDIHYLGFKVMDTLHLNFENGADKLKNVADVRGFEDTYSFHLGGQYLVTDDLTVRAGLRYVLTPIPNGYTTPDGGDADRLVYCGGLAYKINKHFAVDASYSFESIVRKDRNQYYFFIGTYKTYANFAGLSLTYNF